MNLTITVEGTDKAISRLKNVADRIAKTEDLAYAVGEVLADSMRQNILESRTPWGDPFPPLKKFQDKAFREGVSPGMTAHAGPQGIEGRVSNLPLRKTDTLLDSISAEIESSVPGQADVTIGHRVVYGDWQNFGTPIIPARTFMGIRPENLETEAKLTHKFALDALINPQQRMDIYE